MAQIICKQCGFPNPEGSVRCSLCDEPLAAAVAEVTDAVAADAVPAAAVEPAPAQESSAARCVQYYVLCPESQTKTVLESRGADTFFCVGCQREHPIDGIIWQVEEAAVDAPAPSSAAAPRRRLTLEEPVTHHRIAVEPEGGILGRYGQYGAEFFQSRGLLTVSGEHCAIYRDDGGNWILRHISKTNQTKYAGEVLEANEPVVLSNGGLLTLANSVSFVVHID